MTLFRSRHILLGLLLWLLIGRLSCHVRSRKTRPCHGGYGQSRRARLVTAVHIGHVGVASSSGLATSIARASVAARLWMSVRPAMRSILYGSCSSSIISPECETGWNRRPSRSPLLRVRSAPVRRSAPPARRAERMDGADAPRSGLDGARDSSSTKRRVGGFAA